MSLGIHIQLIWVDQMMKKIDYMYAWYPWARHRTPNCSWWLCVCVCSLLDGLNAEYKFLPHHFHFLFVFGTINLALSLVSFYISNMKFWHFVQNLNNTFIRFAYELNYVFQRLLRETVSFSFTFRYWMRLLLYEPLFYFFIIYW